MNNSATEILNTIKASKNVLINMDTRTDYDALSGSLVLSNFIDTLGIKNTVIHASDIGEKFEQFYSHEKIKTNTDISTINLTDFDLLIFMDTGTRSHISNNMGFMVPKNITTINFDHHASNDFFGKLNYIYPFGSCCSVLFKFFEELEIELDIAQLNILVVGILTDTGFFIYDTVKPEDFEITAKLMRRGIQVWDFITKLGSYEYLDQVKFKKIIYSNLKVDLLKKYAYSTLTLAELNVEGIDLNKVVVRHSDLLKFIREVDFAFVIAELDTTPKSFEVSFRSKNPNIDVSQMAKAFGGGGHKTGASAKLEALDLNEALMLVLQKLNL